MVESLLCALVLAPTAKQPFNFRGMFVEGCSCASACAFELTGAMPGCNAAGFYSFTSGGYKGAKLAGSKAAFVAGSSGWLRFYFDGPTAAARKAVRSFILDAFKEWGKPEQVSDVKISIAGSSGKYTATVANVLKLTTEAVKGGDGKTAPSYSNIFNSTLHPTILQAKTTTCSYADGKHSFEFKGTNAFFHPALKVSGKL